MDSKATWCQKRVSQKAGLERGRCDEIRIRFSCENVRGWVLSSCVVRGNVREKKTNVSLA